MSFNILAYIQGQQWMGNEYLINPLTAVKKCQCCNKPKYTSEYIDCLEFTDGKLPTCIACMRSKKYMGKCADILDKHKTKRTCKECGDVCKLSDMSMNWSRNEVGKKCQNCTKKAIKKAFS